MRVPRRLGPAAFPSVERVPREEELVRLTALVDHDVNAVPPLQVFQEAHVLFDHLTGRLRGPVQLFQDLLAERSRHADIGLVGNPWMSRMDRVPSSAASSIASSIESCPAPGAGEPGPTESAGNGMTGLYLPARNSR